MLFMNEWKELQKNTGYSFGMSHENYKRYRLFFLKESQKLQNVHNIIQNTIPCYNISKFQSTYKKSFGYFFKELFPEVLKKRTRLHNKDNA